MHTLIIGGGTAGITLAKRILERDSDARVTMVDAGPYVEQKNKRKWLDYVSAPKEYDPYKELQDVKDDVEGGDANYLNLEGSRYFAVGGSTNVWGGWCIRYNEEDFHLKSNTGHGYDWPFDYHELAPYYSKAEKTLWVAGTDKPNPEIPYTLKDGVIIETLEKMNLPYEHLPLARKAQCATIGTCKYCPIGMRYIPHDDFDDISSDFSERFKVIHNSLAREINMASKTRAKGVTIFDRTKGTLKKLKADRIVVSAGAIESPKLLQKSRSSYWLNGIGNDHLSVGKNITAHPLVRVVGFRKGNPDNYEQPIDFPTLASRGYDNAEYQKKHQKLFFVRDGRKNTTQIASEMLDQQTREQIIAKMRSSLPFELRGFIEAYRDDQNYIQASNNFSKFGGFKTLVNFKKTQQIHKAITNAEILMKNILLEAGCAPNTIKYETYSTMRADHATSTCLMHDNPILGVVDSNLKVHGVDNIYINSNAVIPNGAAVNPTLTLIALTERLADHLHP